VADPAARRLGLGDAAVRTAPDRHASDRSCDPARRHAVRVVP
jgi:hypothetical protein